MPKTRELIHYRTFEKDLKKPLTEKVMRDKFQVTLNTVKTIKQVYKRKPKKLKPAIIPSTLNLLGI